ncbi:MAG: hypothetical protein IT204_04815 [Fimbriimonadaceae bacterium]|nr:hypothetical protein [Fimbriimonadaceae bacterium]
MFDSTWYPPLLTLAIFVVARDAWCHAWYPVRARVHAEQGEWALACLAWQAYLDVWTLTGGPGKLAARLQLGRCELNRGNAAAALAHCEALLQRRLGHLEAGVQRLRADSLTRLGRHEEAAAASERAVELGGGRAEHSLALLSDEIRAHDAAGRWREGLTALEALAETALKLVSEEPLLQIRARLARRRLELGFYEAAAMTAESVLARAGLEPSLQLAAQAVTARAYLAMDRLDQARRDAEAAWRRACEIGDREAILDTGLTLAEVAQHRGDYVGAMRQLQEVREVGGHGRWLAALGEAELLAEWGRHAEAGRAFEQARANLPQVAEAGPHPALLAALWEAGARADQDPTAALQILRPHLESPCPDPRLRVRRAALAAWLLTVADDPAAAEQVEAMQAGAADFAHDRHLLVECDLAAAQIAQYQNRPADAANLLRSALERPCQKLGRAAILLALGDLEQRLGRLDAATTAWAEAAAGHAETEAVVLARQRLQVGAA